jgi:hypothetical protein
LIWGGGRNMKKGKKPGFSEHKMLCHRRGDCPNVVPRGVGGPSVRSSSVSGSGEWVSWREWASM